MPPHADLERRIAAIAALDQPLRRRLYRVLDAADGWVSRDEAAAALGVARSVAAFHLDKLAEAGVVDVRFERTSGRSGPGAGRPAKLYRPRADEVTVSVPDRRYDLAGSLLATAVAESARTGLPVEECLRAAARTAGRQHGDLARADESAELLTVLAEQGYEPEVIAGGEIALANCPFHRLAEEHRQLVCGMNLDFLEGVLEGLATDVDVRARLDPSPGYCCVRIAAA